MKGLSVVDVNGNWVFVPYHAIEQVHLNATYRGSIKVDPVPAVKIWMVGCGEDGGSCIIVADPDTIKNIKFALTGSETP